MGLESATYILVPNDNAIEAPLVLHRLGGQKRSPVSSVDEFERWTLRGEDYWIDAMIGGFGPGSKFSVSVRVALSNPVQVENALHRLLRELLDQVPGRLFDEQTKRSYTHMSEEAWGEIRAGYEQKRARFQQYFGPFEAAVSGEDVFSKLRASKSGN